MSWSAYLRVETKRSDRPREAEVDQVPGNGLGAVNGLLCSYAMERHKT